MLDFFIKTDPNECTHGHKVLDVIHQLLDDYGLSTWKTNIQTYELDFFSDRGRSKKIVDKFITQNNANPEIQGVLQDALNKLLQSTAEMYGRYSVPLLYLQALFFDLLSQNETSVISSSPMRCWR